MVSTPRRRSEASQATFNFSGLQLDGDALGDVRLSGSGTAAEHHLRLSFDGPQASFETAAEGRLLGDKWKSSATDILTEARGAIEAHRNDWTPEDTDELNAALRVRIDETLTEWLKETVRARMDELHGRAVRHLDEAEAAGGTVER